MAATSANDFLFEACERGDLSVIQQHVQSLSPSEIAAIRDEHQGSLAHSACRYNHIHILDYLIQQKHLDLTQIRTDLGGTCAHEAAVCDRKVILDYLFNHPITNEDPQQHKKLRWHVRDDDGNSPLHLAAGYGASNVLRYLLNEESADASIRSHNGFQPLHYAAVENHIECAKILLHVAPEIVNGQTNDSLTPLYLACQRGSLDMIKLLLSNGASLKMNDQNGLSCLHTACELSQVDVVKYLIENHNSNVNAVDYSDKTPLHCAAANGNTAIITYLLENNARITAESDGNTPVHVAAKNGHENARILLIDAGKCDENAVNPQKLTPANLADQVGFSALANELRLRTQPPPPIPSSLASPMIATVIRLEKATITRLAVKRENVSPVDASHQISDDDLPAPSPFGPYQTDKTSQPPAQLLNNEFEHNRGTMTWKKHGFVPRSAILPTTKTQQYADSSNA